MLRELRGVLSFPTTLCFDIVIITESNRYLDNYSSKINKKNTTRNGAIAICIQYLPTHTEIS